MKLHKKRAGYFLLVVLITLLFAPGPAPAQFQEDEAADLELSASLTPQAPYSGDQVQLSLSITNNGPDPAENVFLTNTLPGNLQWISTSTVSGYCEGTQPVLCEMGTLDPMQTVHVTITALALASGEDSNHATANSDTFDPDQTNNTVVLDVNILELLADLSLSKIVSPQSVLPGDVLIFNLSVQNLGPDAAAAVDLTDAIPASLQLVSAVPTQGTCEGAAIVTCSLGDLPAGGVASVQISAAAATNAPPGTIQNQASVTSSTTDPDTSNNQASVEATILAFTADLTISQTASPSPVTAGSRLTYTINGSNLGPHSATGTVIQFNLPAQTNLFSFSPSKGSCSGSPAVTCQVGGLGPGESVSVSLVVDVSPSAAGQLELNTSISANEADPSPANNTHTLTTPITALADLRVSLSASPDPVPPGEALEYLAQVRNFGPSTTASAVLVFSLPSQLSFEGFTPPSASCTASPSEVTCQLGNLNPEQSLEVRLQTRVASGVTGYIGMQVEITSPTPDPHPSSNKSFIITAIESPGEQPSVGLVFVYPPPDPGVVYVGSERVLLEVSVNPEADVAFIYYTRWEISTEGGQWVSIGVGLEPPYQVVLEAAELQYGWNDIRAWAFDSTDTPIEWSRTLIYRLHEVYHPVVLR
jgi:large repetitive protein